MHAILLVFDESEKIPRNKTQRCECIKKSSLFCAEKLLKYLRLELLLEESHISILYSSQFSRSYNLYKELKEIISRHQEDDILLYYTGHGKKSRWVLGPRKDFFTDKIVKYLDLKEIIKSFQGNLILINDCCAGLAIEKYLEILKGRYLLFGASRPDCDVSSSTTVLDSVLNAWRRRKRAYPKVYRVERDKDGLTDYPGAETIPLGYCPCEKNRPQAQRCKMRRRPSLRRGSDLDHLCFPVR